MSRVESRSSGIALIMVLMTLVALLMIGVPFLASMIGFGKSGEVSREREIAVTGSLGSVEWAEDSLALDARFKTDGAVVDYGLTEGAGKVLDPADLPTGLNNRLPVHAGTQVEDETGRIDVNSLTLRLARNLLEDDDNATNVTDNYEQAVYKIMLYPLRPMGNQDWLVDPKGPRDCYRPFYTVTGLRQIANIIDIAKDPPINADNGFMTRTMFNRIQDSLRVDYRALKSRRWINASLLVQNAAQNAVSIYAVHTAGMNAGTLVRIEDLDSGAYEFNFCTAAEAYSGNFGGGPGLNNVHAERNQMKLSLLFPLRQSYTADTTQISVPARVPVNINTASYRTLKSLIWGLQGVIKGKIDGGSNLYAVTEEEAERIAADIITQRAVIPFSPDVFMGYDIADLIDDLTSLDEASVKAALIKMNAFNPHDPRLTRSTVGFRFSSDHLFRLTGLSSIVNRHSGLETSRRARGAVMDVYPQHKRAVVTMGSSFQYEFVRDTMAGPGGLNTGPNPLAARDFGITDGIQNFDQDDASEISYITLAPLGTVWNPGYNERTSFLLNCDAMSKSTVFDGDTGFNIKCTDAGSNYYKVGDQDHTGTAMVTDSGSAADGWRNDLTPEGVDLGADTDGAATENDYLEYELRSAADDTNSKLQRINSLEFEPFSFDFWVRTRGNWDDTKRYYLLDITRDDTDRPALPAKYSSDPEWTAAKEFENRISIFYDGTADDPSTSYFDGELVLRIKDTAEEEAGLPMQFTELRQKAAFQPGLWYHVQIIGRAGGKGGYTSLSTDYKTAILIDGKPAWKVDPDDDDTKICYPVLNPGSFLASSCGNGDMVLQLDNTDSLPNSGVVAIGRERIEYTGKGPNSLSVCKRGARTTAAVPHEAGDRVVLFGYSASIDGFPLMVGGGALSDSLLNAPDFGQETVAADQDADLAVDFEFNAGDGSVTLPPTADLLDFPDSGFVEITCSDGAGSYQAIAYFQKAGQTLTFAGVPGAAWTAVQTNDEVAAAGVMSFPDTLDTDRHLRNIVFKVISVQVSSNMEYPTAEMINGKRGYIAVDDEWIEYGREDCTQNSGKVTYDPGSGAEYYFIGDTSQRASMGSIAAAHPVDTAAIPVFQVSNGHDGPMLSNQPGCPKDIVTVIDVDNTDDRLEAFKEQHTIRRSGRSSYQSATPRTGAGGESVPHMIGLNWLSFYNNVSQGINNEAGSRLVKFPSGEMPFDLAKKITIGNSRNHTDPVSAELDDIRLNRSGYNTAYIWDIDNASVMPDDEPPLSPKPTTSSLIISSAETIDAANPRWLEINRTATGNNQVNGEDFKPSGYIRINNEVFAYIFDRALPYLEDPYWLPAEWSIPARYKIRLIERGCFKTLPRTHRRWDTVFVMESLPATTISTGDDIDEDDARIHVLSHKGFPPAGFLRIDDEIIGYTHKGTTSTGKDFFGIECTPDIDRKAYFRGRYGSTPAVHTEESLVTLFRARYPDHVPVTRDAAGAVTDRWAAAGGSYYRKIIQRDGTTFGLADTDTHASKDKDLVLRASVLDKDGNRSVIPDNMQIRLLVGAGENIDWAQTPPAPADDTDDLQEFIIAAGDGGEGAGGAGKDIEFNLRARTRRHFELRAFFEYLPGVWDAAKDIAIFDPDYDPLADGILNWKLCPVIENLAVQVRGENVTYENLVK